MRNNVQRIYYFVSKKQKTYFLRYLKSIYYIFYKFEKNNNNIWWYIIYKLEQTNNTNILWND